MTGGEGGVAPARYLDYPLEALLFDAEAGNTDSRTLVFECFATLAERGQPIPGSVAKYVGNLLRQVIAGELDAGVMFNPEGHRPRSEYEPLHADYLALFPKGPDLKGGRDINARFEQIGEALGVSTGRVKTQYYKHRKYARRIDSIQALLDERRHCQSYERSREIFHELKALTATS